MIETKFIEAVTTEYSSAPPERRLLFVGRTEAQEVINPSRKGNERAHLLVALFACVGKTGIRAYRYMVSDDRGPSGLGTYTVSADRPADDGRQIEHSFAGMTIPVPTAECQIYVPAADLKGWVPTVGGLAITHIPLENPDIPLPEGMYLREPAQAGV